SDENKCAIHTSFDQQQPGKWLYNWSENQDCNGDCFGDAVEDECGVCYGDNSSCLDCCDVINGSGDTCDGECGPCNDEIDEGDCDCDGNVIDCNDECGGVAIVRTFYYDDDGDGNGCTVEMGASENPTEFCDVLAPPLWVLNIDEEEGECLCNSNDTDECGICGGDGAVFGDNGCCENDVDQCGECNGGNQSCLNPSSEMSAYYFPSITLDGEPLTFEDEIIALNESSGRMVGYATFNNVGAGYTEVLVYGEMDDEIFEDSSFNTDGYMLEGDTPQFYVNGIKANYFAADEDTLQNIPAFSSPSIHNNLSLNLITDCNGDMGGSAAIDYCGECFGGETGLENGWYDVDDDGVCDSGAANGDADNCQYTQN
ncbi:uncharacterized protein METZ01_LOCUS312061, partial [marine metagenome]